MKDAATRLREVLASVNQLTTVAGDWTSLLTGIINRLSMPDRMRISQGMHIGWSTGNKEVRAYARACVLVEALLAPPIAGAYVNPSGATQNYLRRWGGNDAAKARAGKMQLDALLRDHGPKANGPDNSDYMRPLAPGAGFSHADHGGPGTIGCFVRRRGGSEVFGLTNAHIMKHNPIGQQNAARVVLQPAAFAGGSFAYIVGEYADHRLDNDMDAALIKLDVGVQWTNTTPDGRVIAGHNPVIARDDPVSKYGYRTRRNDGRIENTNFDGAGFRGQYRVLGNEGFQSNGDSGSVIVNANNQVVGLMHQGGDNIASGLAVPIQRVLDHFNVDIA